MLQFSQQPFRTLSFLMNISRFPIRLPYIIRSVDKFKITHVSQPKPPKFSVGKGNWGESESEGRKSFSYINIPLAPFVWRV